MLFPLSQQVIDQTSKWLELGERVFRIVGLLFAAWWVVFRLYGGSRQRTKIEPSVSGRVIDIAGKQYLIISARVKNTGSSQLAFEERASGGRQVYDWKASGIRVLTTNLVRDAAMVGGVQWDHYVTLDFAPQAQWFDPGEQVTDEQMIELPAGKRAVKLELAIRFSSTEAGCTAIVGVPTKSLNLYVETDKVSVSDWLYKEANHESE